MDIGAILLGVGVWVGGIALGSLIMPFVKVKGYKLGNKSEATVNTYIEKIKDVDARKSTKEALDKMRADFNDPAFKKKLYSHLDILKKLPGPADDLLVEGLKSVIEGFAD